MTDSVQDRKVCTNCSLSYDLEAWQTLALVGYQAAADPQGRPIAIELRNCACGSTLVVPVLLALLRRRVDDCGERVARTAAQTAIAILSEQVEIAERELRLLRRRAIVAQSRAGVGED